MTHITKKYLTPAEVSARFSVSVRTLANWRTLGQGPKFTKMGGKVMYPIDQVEHWESRNTVQSTSEYSRA